MSFCPAGAAGSAGFRSAEKFQIEEIIDPRDTRRLLCEFASIVAPLRTTRDASFGYRP